MTNETYEKVLYVLKNTRDGDELTGKDLKIIESAVNGFLSDLGMKYFDCIYDKVKSGLYEKNLAEN
jgi:hypothetical protein